MSAFTGVRSGSTPFNFSFLELLFLSLKIDVSAKKGTHTKREFVVSVFFFFMGFDNPRSVSACVPEAFALSTSLFYP